MGWFIQSSRAQLCRAVASGSDSKHLLLWLEWLVVLGMLTVWPGMVHAAGDSSIRGVIQRQGKGVAEHRIMLIRLGPNDALQRTPGQTDAQGRFVFDKLDAGEEFEYVVGIRYEGQLYRSASITLKSGEDRTGVVVEVAQGAAQAPKSADAQPMLHIMKHFMVVALQEDHLEVQEIVNLRYNGSTPYTGAVASPGHTAFSLHFPLPQGYYNLRNVQGLDANHVQSLPAGLYYTAPLAPGEHRVVYTYALPFRGDMTVIFTDRTLPTTVFDIFVEETHLVAASDLQFGGRVAATPHAFLHFRGTDLAARTRSWLQLTHRTASAPLLQIGMYALTLGIALLGIAIPSYGVWRARTRPDRSQPMTPAQLQELHAAHGGLLRTIARLDDQHEAGTLDEDTYRQRRHRYKEQLIELAEYLHNSQQPKEDSP